MKFYLHKFQINPRWLILPRFFPENMVTIQVTALIIHIHIQTHVTSETQQPIGQHDIYNQCYEILKHFILEAYLMIQIFKILSILINRSSFSFHQNCII